MYVSTSTNIYRTRHNVECRCCQSSGPVCSTKPNCSTLDTARSIAGSVFDWNHKNTLDEWGEGTSATAILKLYDRRAAFIAKHCNPTKPTTKGKTKP